MREVAGGTVTSHRLRTTQNWSLEFSNDHVSRWLLQMGYPWEIPRNDISYPIKFFGKVVDLHDGKKEWVGGENVRAFAYDVPIPGFRTKNTISLRLWSTRVAAEDFDLASFNAGNYSKAAEAHANAERVRLLFARHQCDLSPPRSLICRFCADLLCSVPWR